MQLSYLLTFSSVANVLRVRERVPLCFSTENSESLLTNRKFYYLLRKNLLSVWSHSEQLSIEDWHNIKAEQNAHNEILAFLLLIVGVNLLIGGLIVTVFVVGEPVFNPFSISFHAGNYTAFLGLIMTMAGFSILAAGFVLVIDYDRKRTWHIKEVEKAALFKNRKFDLKSPKEMLEEIAKAQKNSEA